MRIDEIIRPILVFRAHVILLVEADIVEMDGSCRKAGADVGVIGRDDDVRRPAHAVNVYLL